MPAHLLIKRLGYPGLAKHLVKSWEKTKIRKLDDPVPVLPEWMAYRYEWDERVKVAFPTFSDKTLKEHGIGFDPDRRRATVPIRDEHGQLVGFSGRAAYPSGLRYLLYGSAELGVQGYRFAQTRFLWGAHTFYRQAIVKPTRVFVAEGFKQRMRLVEAGFPNVVSLMTRTLSASQLKVLERVADEIVLALDRDKPGTESAQALARTTLRPYRMRGRLFYFAYAAAQADHLSAEQLSEQAHRIVPIEQLMIGDGKPTPLSARARAHRRRAKNNSWSDNELR